MFEFISFLLYFVSVNIFPTNQIVRLDVLVRQAGKHPERVFTFNGKPVAWANTRAWREALKRAGIEDFRWHDLRHTWASWLVQRGTPTNVLQEMGAWESEGMVRRYAHLAPAHLAEHAERIAGLVSGTNLAQSPKEKGPGRSQSLDVW